MKKILLGAGGLILLAILAGYGISWFLQQPGQTTERIPIASSEELPDWQAQLYFIAPDGSYLQPEARQLPGCADDRDCIRSLLEALRSGSNADLLPVLPKQTGILEIELENDLVRINFSRQLSNYHPGGSLSELLTVYSLVNSLSENFPYLRQVQILMDGQIQQTLKGHVRIDQPVYADFDYSHPPLVPEPPAEAEANPQGDLP